MPDLAANRKGGESRPISDRTSQPSTDGPLLASEALRDDLAPSEPLALTSRIVGAIFAVACVVTAMLPSFGVTPLAESHNPAWTGAILGAAAAAFALLPLAYSTRSVLMLGLAAAAGAMAVGGFGPGFALRLAAGPWSSAHLAALWALPAALLFRARYRAYPPARWLLLVGLLLALPHAAADVLRIVDAWEPAIRVAHGVALVAVLLSLVGFMGAETTGAGDAIAWTVTASITAALSSEILWPATGLAHDGPPLTALASIASVGLCGMVGALGACGAMAAKLGPRAREQAPQSSRTAPRRARQPSIGGWLSRW